MNNSDDLQESSYQNIERIQDAATRSLANKARKQHIKKKKQARKKKKSKNPFNKNKSISSFVKRQVKKQVIKVAKRVAKLVAKVMKALAKALKQLIKAVADAIKELVSSPYFWIAVAVILVIFLIGFLIYSIYVQISDEKGMNHDYAGTHSNKVQEVIDENGNIKTVVEEYTSVNAAVRAFYEIMSKRSVWQYNDNGELINYTDENAVQDYFEREEMLCLNPEFLYCVNESFFGDRMVYPEQFILPVPVTEDFKLEDVVNEEGVLQVTSKKRNLDTGKENGEENSLSDYGFGSVVKYKEEKISSVLKGKYIKQEVWDEEQSKVVEKSIDEEFSFETKEEKVHVIDKAVTFAGVLSFDYTETEEKEELEDNESDNEKDQVKNIVYKEVKVKLYKAKDKKGNIVTEKTKAWCKKNGYTVEGEPVEKTITLRKIRSDDSGVYTTVLKPVTEDDGVKADEMSNYLYNYMTKFNGYIPTYATREYGDLYDIQGVSNGEEDYTSTTTNKKSSATQTVAYVQEFLDTIIPFALKVQKETGVNAAVLIAQAALESSWGRSDLTVKANNYFGMKGTGTNGSMKFLTREIYDGREVYVEADFQAYKSLEDSAFAYAELIWLGIDCGDHYDERYKEAVGKDYRTAITIIRDAGYCTEVREKYINTCCDIIESNGLDKLDTDPDYQWDGKTPDFVKKALKGKKNNNDSSSSIVEETEKLSGLSDTDMKIFEKFLNAFGEETSLKRKEGSCDKVSVALTEDEINDLLIYTKCYSEGRSYSDYSNLTYSNVNYYYCGVLNLEESDTKDDSDESTDSGGIYIGNSEYLWPVPSCIIVTSEFGLRIHPVYGGSSFHNGLDIGCSTNSDVVAVKEGTVLFSGYAGTAGNMVCIMHEGNLLTRYLHNNSVLVKAGDKVKRGQVIAKSGNTGTSSGPHLHIDFKEGATNINDGTYVNPRKYITPDDTLEKTVSGEYKSKNTTTAVATTTQRKAMVELAISKIGNPYVWGGNDLDKGVDCSGFTQQIYLSQGITIERVAQNQYSKSCNPISRDELQPGDLIFYGSSTSTIEHVALYIGNGKIVHAANEQIGIEENIIDYDQPICYGRVKNCKIK